MLLIHGFEGLRSYSAIIAVCDPVPVAAEEQEQVSGGFSGRTHRGRRNQQHTGIGKGQRSSSVNRALIQADHIVATRNLLAFVFLIVSSHFRSNRCTWPPLPGVYCNPRDGGASVHGALFLFYIAFPLPTMPALYNWGGGLDLSA